MAGITWLIDTDNYTDKQLQKLSHVIYDYDYSISKHIDEELEERKAKAEAERKEKERLRKLVLEEERRTKSVRNNSSPLGRKPKWTEETIPAEAAKYKNRSEFSRNSAGAYFAAKGLNMLDTLFPITKTTES